MAHLRCDFFSDALGSEHLDDGDPAAADVGTQIGMTEPAPPGPPPVLYLLHGLCDDDTIWLRRTSIERYAAPLGLAVVMPQVHRSFYADEAHGHRYWTFLSEELPALVALVLPGVDPAGGHLRRRPVDGRLRGAEVGAAPAGAVRRGRQPVRRTERRRPAHRAGAARRPPTLFDRVFGGAALAGTDDDLLALLDRPPAADPAAAVLAAAPRTRSTPTTEPSRPPAPAPRSR